MTVQRICKWLFFRVFGFTANDSVEKPDKCVVIMAPHTSNWDFIIGMLYAYSQGFHCGFMMKREWFFWPLGPIFRRLGGVPIRRDKSHGLTDQMAETAMLHPTFHLCITPEGTRRKQTHWHRGFYFIALKANIPILLCGMDYKRRYVECTQSFMPSGDVEADMRIVMDYFKNFEGKHPERFATEEID